MKFVTFSTEQQSAFYNALNRGDYNEAVRLIRQHKVTQLTFNAKYPFASAGSYVEFGAINGFAQFAPALDEIKSLQFSHKHNYFSVSTLLACCPNVTAVQVDWNDLFDNEISQVCGALEKLPHLTSLSIDRARLVNGSPEVLAKLLEAKADTLTELVLSRVDINVPDIPVICRGLRSLTKLEKFHFSQTYRNDAEVLSALFALPNLTTIWLGSHSIDPAQLGEFCEFLKKRHPQFISLGLDISRLSTEEIEDLLACCTGLRELTLTCRAEHRATVFTALKNLTQLEELCIGSTTACPSDEVALLAGSLKQLSRLRELDLDVGIDHLDTEQYLLSNLDNFYGLTDIVIHDESSQRNVPSGSIAVRNRHYQKIQSQLSQILAHLTAPIQQHVVGGDSDGAAFDVVDLCNLFNSTQLLLADALCQRFSAERRLELQNHYLLLVTQFLMRCFYEIEVETAEMPLRNAAFLSLEKAYRDREHILKLAGAALAQITPDTSFHAMACYAIGQGCQRVAIHTKGPSPLRAAVLKFFSECQRSTSFQQNAEEDERAAVIYSLRAIVTPDTRMTLITDQSQSVEAVLELRPVPQFLINVELRRSGPSAVDFSAGGEEKNLADIGARLSTLLRPAIDAEVDARSKKLIAERDAAEAAKLAEERAARIRRYENFLAGVNRCQAESRRTDRFLMSSITNALKGQSCLANTVLIENMQGDVRTSPDALPGYRALYGQMNHSDLSGTFPNGAQEFFEAVRNIQHEPSLPSSSYEVVNAERAARWSSISDEVIAPLAKKYKGFTSADKDVRQNAIAIFENLVNTPNNNPVLGLFYGRIDLDIARAVLKHLRDEKVDVAQLMKEGLEIQYQRHKKALEKAEPGKEKKTVFDNSCARRLLYCLHLANSAPVASSTAVANSASVASSIPVASSAVVADSTVVADSDPAKAATQPKGRSPNDDNDDWLSEPTAGGAGVKGIVA